MEILAENGLIASWLLEYGSIVLFVLLIAGIVAFPVPEETLLVICGIFMHTGNLPIAGTLLAAFAGSLCGITASYLIGQTFGSYFIHKYGSWVGMTDHRLSMVHKWFEKYGTWMLFIGYFIPGVRHFTGFFAGTSRLKYSSFALYAYTGAVVWVTLFLSVGYFFGSYWHNLVDLVELHIEVIVISSIALSLTLIAYMVKIKYQKVNSDL